MKYLLRNLGIGLTIVAIVVAAWIGMLVAGRALLDWWFTGDLSARSSTYYRQK
jgi:hypothetical protein